MPNRRPILIIEDDETLRNMLAEHLEETREFVVTGVDRIERADQVFDNEEAHFDAIILDVGLPDGDGCDYCARLRRQGHSLPIIMLTG
ncbi:MAG TPA: response regulator, partial [Ktedonobacterales bacterium]|nr:response regulator [Ktedonobacterales bacterium]